MSRFIGGVYMHFLYVLAFLFLPISAMSWGPLGHRVTAEVSKKFLSDNAKKKINELNSKVLFLGAVGAGSTRS